MIDVNWKVENLVKSQSGHAEKPFAGHMWSDKFFNDGGLTILLYENSILPGIVCLECPNAN